MTTQQMKCFMAVASCGSFSAAADQLFLSQSTVSYQIRALEKEYDFKLFERDSHGVKLSPAGDSFYKSMLTISEEYLSAIDRARQFQHRDGTQIRLCFACPTSPMMMGKLLARINDILANAEITLINRSLYDTMQPLLSGEADILLTYPGFLRPGLPLEHKEIAKAWTTCLMSAAHPLAGRRTLTLDELTDQTIILPDLPNARIEFDEIYRWAHNNKSSAFRIDSSPRTIDQAQGLAAVGNEIMFVHTLESEYQQNTDGLVGIPMADIPAHSLIAVWNSATLSYVGSELIQKLCVDGSC